MFLRIAFVVCASFSLSGCLGWAWIGYDDNFVGAAPNSTAGGCPAQIGVQNLNPDQKAAILDAVGTVCDIFADEDFAKTILAKDDWIASCTINENGQKDAIAAADVLRIVRLPKDDVSFQDRRPLNAVAQIDPANSRIAIPKKWYSNWQNGTREDRSKVIETIAHELTHFARENGQQNFRFQDGGWKRCDPNKETLASYVIGKMARDFWLEQNPE